jgi:hypothetical protein
MKNSILLKDLSENCFDKIVVNDDVRAGWWLFTTCKDESWWFTFTNGDNSSNTGCNCGG